MKTKAAIITLLPTYLYTLQNSANLPETGCIYECFFRLYIFKNNQKRLQNTKRIFGCLCPIE